jgi:hypothetical protein
VSVVVHGRDAVGVEYVARGVRVLGNVLEEFEKNAQEAAARRLVDWIAIGQAIVKRADEARYVIFAVNGDYGRQRAGA